MTGTTWVEESGFLEGPVMLTNTFSIGVVSDAVIAWRRSHGGPDERDHFLLRLATCDRGRECCGLQSTGIAL
jgi:D-aminopeptidase